MILKRSKVQFDELTHKYTLEDKSLSGVTALLHRQLFKGKYDGIPKEVMDKAAERGNLIHRQIEIYEALDGDTPASSELRSYLDLKRKYGFETIASEWLVSDNEHVASAIDVIYDTGKGLVLCDIKTTSKLDMEYLSWQLSVYKYLLLKDNPDVKVQWLFACWLPKEQYGKPKMVEVKEKPMEWVKELIECDARGEQWECPVVAEQSLAVPQELTRAIASYLEAEKKAKEMKERLRSLMEEHGVTKWENDDFVATIGKASTNTTFDAKAFQKDNKELYEKYLKTTERKGSFTVKLK